MPAEFPKKTLEQSLAMPDALMKNSGHPLPPIDMAGALGISPGSSTLRILNAAASAYGLITGTYKSTFKMADLGQKIVQPNSPEERAGALVAAALRPPLFQRVFDHYKGKKYPEAQYMANTLKRDFDVADAHADVFVEIFTANARHVGLLKSTKGGEWLVADAASAVPGVPATEEASDDEFDDEPTDGQDDDAIEIPAGALTPPAPQEPQRQKRPNKLFIGHGRSKKPLDQLTKTLRELGIPHVVAEDEPNSGRPISKKVRDTMDQCGAAILIFSADVEYFDRDGESVWRPSENVDHELGAAAVMYDDRVILFKEESITLASNFSGIGYITFEKDKLDAKTNELLRELIALKILKVSVDDD